MKILIEKIDKTRVLTAVIFYLCLDDKQVKDVFEINERDDEIIIKKLQDFIRINGKKGKYNKALRIISPKLKEKKNEK